LDRREPERLEVGWLNEEIGCAVQRRRIGGGAMKSYGRVETVLANERPSPRARVPTMSRHVGPDQYEQGVIRAERTPRLEHIEDAFLHADPPDEQHDDPIGRPPSRGAQCRALDGRSGRA